MKKVLLTFTAVIAGVALQAAVIPLELVPVSGTGTDMDGKPVPNIVGTFDSVTLNYSYVLLETSLAFNGGGTRTIDGGSLAPVPEIALPNPPVLTVLAIAPLEDDLINRSYYAVLTDGGQVVMAGAIIPEPHEYALIAGVGLLGLAAYRRLRA